MFCGLCGYLWPEMLSEALSRMRCVGLVESRQAYFLCVNVFHSLIMISSSSGVGALQVSSAPLPFFEGYRSDQEALWSSGSVALL